MALQPAPRRLKGGDREAESDEELASRAMVLDDPSAFETLVRRHQRRVHYLLERFTGNRAVAEELCQETFLRAWRKLGSFENRGAFAGWLTKLAWNVFLQHRRRTQVSQASRSLEEPGTASAAEQAATAPGPTGALPDVERLLAAVSPEEQRLLVLTYAEGLSATEIGEMLGVPPGTVKSQIHRAKDRIRRQFSIEVTP